MVSIHRRGWLVALMILFAATVLRIHAIHSTYMRDDEEISYRSTQYDLLYSVDFQARRDVQAPLWYPSFWLWQQLMGDSEFMGRVYSIFLSMLTLGMMYQIGKRWFGAARYALFALAVLGVNAFFYIYSMEIRPYALVMLTAAVSMWFFWRWLEQGTRRAAILYGLSLALMLYAHYFLVFLIVVQAIYFLWVMVVRRQEDGPCLRFVRQGVGAGLVALVVWLPWLPVFIGQLQTLRRLEGDAERGIGIANTTEPTTIEAILRLVYVITNGQPGLYALVLVAGLVFWWRRPHPPAPSPSGRGEETPHEQQFNGQSSYVLALLWGLGVPVIAFTVNLAASVYTQRYVTYLSLGLALAAGAALASLVNKQRKVYGAALVAFIGVNLWALPSQLPVHTPFRDLLGDMSRAAKPGDVIFFDHADISDNFFQWQFRHYLTEDLQENSFTGLERVRDARRIWHVTAHWFDDEVETNFRDIERTHPRQMGFGKCDLEWCYLIQLMEAPPSNEAAVFGEVLPFWGVDVDSVTESTIQTRLWWRVEQTPGLDYSMSLQLLDSSSHLVAQSDGPINHYGEVVTPTSQLAPGQLYIDHRELTLPADFPAGDYRLALVVYQPWDGVRLTLPDGSDSLILETVQIP